MKALILAGGLATRLRPLTYARPKHLLPIANKPHIEHVFDLLRRHGVTDVVLLTSHLAEAFHGAIDVARSTGLDVEVTHEPEPLGTAGALKNAEGLLAGESFFVFNGDVLSDVDLGQVRTFHRERRAEATIVLTPVEDPSAFGVVPTERDGRVLGFIEKPLKDEAPTNLINAGIYVMEPSVLARIPAGESWSTERALFPGMVEERARLFALATEAYWLDIGTPASYLQANLDALSGRYRSDAVEHPADEAVLAAPGAAVRDGARLSSACLGAGAVVDEGALVERSVLLPRAVVGRGAVVRSSILGERARVGAGVHLADRTLGDGEVAEE